MKFFASQKLKNGKRIKAFFIEGNSNEHVIIIGSIHGNEKARTDDCQILFQKLYERSERSINRLIIPDLNPAYDTSLSFEENLELQYESKELQEFLHHIEKWYTPNAIVFNDRGRYLVMHDSDAESYAVVVEETFYVDRTRVKNLSQKPLLEFLLGEEKYNSEIIPASKTYSGENLLELVK